jgi:hypothetical protein
MDKITEGIGIRLQLAEATIDDPYHDRIDRDNRVYIGSTKNMIKDRVDQMASGKTGESLNLYVMNRNRKRLINYVKQKQQKPEELNLNKLSTEQFNLDHFRNRDGKIDDKLLEQAYKQYHYLNF